MAKLFEESASNIIECAEQAGIPNIVEPDALHVTVFKSFNDMSDFVPAGTFPYMLPVEVRMWDVFRTNHGTRCLVLVLDSLPLHIRHSDLREKYGESHISDKYHVYLPHVTVSYDIEDFDPSTIWMKFPKVIYLKSEQSEAAIEDSV